MPLTLSWIESTLRSENPVGTITTAVEGLPWRAVAEGWSTGCSCIAEGQAGAIASFVWDDIEYRIRRF